jgi:hypothetical protein
MKLMRMLAGLTMLWFALGAATAAAQTERYVGTAQIAGEPPIPVHVELRIQDSTAAGEFTIAGGVYRAHGAVTGAEIKGRFAGDGGEGAFTIVRSVESTKGGFDVGGAPGVFDLRRTTVDAKTALGPPPQKLDLTTEQWRRDLDELVRILTREHGSPFHRISRAAFETEIARVREELQRLSGPEAAVALRRLSMLIGDGHTGVGLPWAQPRYPLVTFWFADGLRVVETTPEHRRLLGARVDAVEGTPFRTVAARLRPYSPMGENAWSWRAVLPFLVHRPEVLRHAGVDQGSPSTWTFLLTDGRTERVTFEAGAFPLKGRVRLGGQPPLWEQRAKEPFWTDFQPGSDTLYVNFRSYDALPANAAALAEELDARKPRRLVIDMRDNGGGDYDLGRKHLLPVITSRPWLNRRDRTFVLVGRHTFSAAMSNAADLRWKTNATLVGEPIGETPNSWQESRRFYLPNSGLPVTVSTKFYSFAPQGVEAIEPHIRAEPNWRDWADGHDPALKAILRTRPAGPGRRSPPP